MRHKKAAIVLGALAISTSIAIAGPEGVGGGMGPGQGLGSGSGGRYAEILDLSPEQRQKIDELRRKHRAEAAPLQNRRLAKRSELRALWANPNPDQEKILATQRELAELDLRLREMTTRQRFEMQSLLTPEQRERLQSRGYGMGTGSEHGPGAGRKGRMHGGRW